MHSARRNNTAAAIRQIWCRPRQCAARRRSEIASSGDRRRLKSIAKHGWCGGCRTIPGWPIPYNGALDRARIVARFPPAETDLFHGTSRVPAGLPAAAPAVHSLLECPHLRLARLPDGRRVGRLADVCRSLAVRSTSASSAWSQFLPATVLVLVAGQLADRYDRRLILQLCQGVEGCAAAALAYGSFTGSISKQFILVAVFFLGAGRAFESPTNQTLLPAVVPPELLPRAVAASSVDHAGRHHLGPGDRRAALCGEPDLRLCDLLRAVPVRNAAARLPAAGACTSTRPPLTLATFFAGLSYIRQNRILLGVIMLDLFAVLLGGATALLPIYRQGRVRGRPWRARRSCARRPRPARCSCLAVLTALAAQARVGRIEFVAVAVFGIATIVFGLSRLVLAVVAGAGGPGRGRTRSAS